MVLGVMPHQGARHGGLVNVFSWWHWHLRFLQPVHVFHRRSVPGADRLVEFDGPGEHVLHVWFVVSGDNLARPNWPGVKPPTPGPSTPQEGQSRPPHEQCEDPNCSGPCQKARDGSSCVRLGLCTIAPGYARIVSHEQGRPLQDPSLIC